MDRPEDNSGRLELHHPARRRVKENSNPNVTDSSQVVNSDRELNGDPPETPRKASAISTLASRTNASEAIPPVPLAKEIKRAGMFYREFWRQGNVAIYCAKGNGPRIEYEVIKVQVLPAEQLKGRSYPLRESFPSSSDWGELAWSYTNNSHRDPLAAAHLKAKQIRSKRADGQGLDQP